MVKPAVLISIPFCARAALAACKTLGRCSVLSRFCVFKGSPHRLPMAAWPRNVVKEHRAAAWLLYIFLLSLFITYASFTINHNLQRRDHPVVVEDVVEEAWTLPDIVVCLIYTDGLFELGRYQCLDSNTNEDDCSATAYVSSNVTALEDPKFCVHFETSTLGQRKRGDLTLLEFTWKETPPSRLVDWDRNGTSCARQLCFCEVAEEICEST